MSAVYESLRARAALLGMTLLRSDNNGTSVYVLGIPGDDCPIWASSPEAVHAALSTIEARNAQKELAHHV
jgi:hypothetical protein